MPASSPRLSTEARDHGCFHSPESQRQHERDHILFLLIRERVLESWHRVAAFVHQVENDIVSGARAAGELAVFDAGVNRHADRGIMKAEWDAKDFDHMGWTPLAFTEEE